MPRALGSSILLAAAAVAQTNFPPPPAPAGNPPSQAKALLGMALFFEEQLSSTNTVACATSHDLGRGGVDARTETLHAQGSALEPAVNAPFATSNALRTTLQ
ncbi:MAG TPA: cytochrome c peroxidase [Planctomycetota bacterium]|nr:cytochrome c peroxidase [Planctomycetota bacterium]